jgi:hypothetical protein
MGESIATFVLKLQQKHEVERKNKVEGLAFNSM